MRKIIARIASPVLYGLGHVCSRCVADWQPEWLGMTLARVYQKLMVGAFLIEEWADVCVMWCPMEHGGDE